MIRRILANQIMILFGIFLPALSLWEIFSGNYSILRNHISYKAPIVVDCRLKDWYPPVLVSDEKIVKQVDERFGKILDSIQSPFDYFI